MPGQSSRGRVAGAGGDVGQGAGDGDRGEDQVDIQGVAPGQVLGEHPAEDQAYAGAAGGDRAVDREGRSPLALVGEGAGQGAQRGRREEGAERALQRPRRGQHRERDSSAADGRGDGEPGQPGDEDPLAAEHVADPAAEQQQAAEGQRVARHHPLPVIIRKPQRMLG